MQAQGFGRDKMEVWWGAETWELAELAGGVFVGVAAELAEEG